MDMTAIDRLSDAQAKKILREIFSHATTPAFGILPQRELDLLLFKAMRDCGVIKDNASLYELMTHLKVTRSKARNLLFDLEIRDNEVSEDLDRRARQALAEPRGFVKDGAYLAFGIENPVVQAHIKDKVNTLGHLTDASFDATIVKIKPSAVGPLVASLMDEKEEAEFREAMIEAGFQKDENLETLLTEGLKFIGEKTVGPAATKIGAGYLEDLADFILPHARSAKAKVVSLLKDANVRQKTESAEPKARQL